MFDLFEITAGTIPGRRHVGCGNLLVGRNNQDAYGAVVDAELMVITVFDGCGSGAHTEVGAKVASKIVPAVIAEAYHAGLLPAAGGTARPHEWQWIKAAIVERLRAVVLQMSDTASIADWNHTIQDYMLFTIFGACITRRQTTIFSIGDGIYSINGQSRTIGPFIDNAPPYIGYALMTGCTVPDSDFVVHETRPTQHIFSVVVGTDGLVELEAKAGMRIPGKQRELCSMADLSDDAFFAADQSLTCWLRQVNSEVVKLENHGEPRINREHGLLADDTTMVVARRRR